MCLIQLLYLTKIIYNFFFWKNYLQFKILIFKFKLLYNIYIFRIVIKIQLNIKN